MASGMNVEAMRDFVERFDRMTDDDFTREFQRIREEQDEFRNTPEFSCKIGSCMANFSKNRYRDILPYDHHRIRIANPVAHSTDIPQDALESDEDSPADYINASPISLTLNAAVLDGGTTGGVHAKYIAAQAPLQNTLADFWQMVMNEDVELIVMLCSLVEQGRPKCDRYWPEKMDEVVKFGRFAITLLHEEKIYSNTFKRSLQVKEDDGSERIVCQLHDSEWPDHGCPRGEEHLMSMIEMIHHIRTRPDRPILVHCSAGCGRTGTIIAANMLYEMMENVRLDKIDLFHLVCQLRRQRASMVQTQEQYHFLHLCLRAMCTRHLRVENGDNTGGFANGDLISLDDDPISPSINATEAGGKSDASPDYMDAASSSQLWPGAIVS